MLHCFTMQKIKLFCISFFTLIVIDSIQLMFIARKMMPLTFPALTMESLDHQKLAACLVAWALIALGIVIFVIPRSHGLYYYGLVKGALYGLIIYGVYELTNFIIFEEWSKEFMFYDIAWGTFLCALVTCATLFIAHLIGCETLCNTHDKGKKSCL